MASEKWPENDLIGDPAQTAHCFRVMKNPWQLAVEQNAEKNEQDIEAEGEYLRTTIRKLNERLEALEKKFNVLGKSTADIMTENLKRVEALEAKHPPSSEVLPE